MSSQDQKDDRPSLTVQQLYETVSTQIELRLLAGEQGLQTRIVSPRIQKLGLALSGYTDYLHQGRVQFIGQTEIQYLDTLPAERRTSSISEIFSAGLCCVVVTTGLRSPQELLEEAERHSVPVFLTSALSSVAINEVTGFLEQGLAPSTTIHGVLTDVFGIGVLILGKAGIGKSECALDLILRGHRLVSDDLVVVRKFDRQTVLGSGPDSFHFLLEVRGLGILNIKDLFGVSAVSLSKPIELVIHLIPWDSRDHYDRLGLEKEEYPLLDVPLPKITLPVAPARNLATLVEVAVRVRLLKSQGYDSSRDFVTALESKLRGDKG